MENINEYIKEAPLEIVHSSAEGYMKEIVRENLKVVDTSLIPCMVG